MSSHLSALTFASNTTVVSEHGPDLYERTSYYNGITGDGDHLELVYRSDYLTTPFPKGAGGSGGTITPLGEAAADVVSSILACG